MNRIKTAAAAIAALAITMGSANAACSLSTVSNKTWVMSAVDAGQVHKYLLACAFKTSAAGTISLTPMGCTVNYGTDTTFTAPYKIDLYSGSFTQVADKLCAFDLHLSFGDPITMTARIILESGKSTGTGNWISTFSSYGSATIARQ